MEHALTYQQMIFRAVSVNHHASSKRSENTKSIYKKIVSVRLSTAPLRL